MAMIARSRIFQIILLSVTVSLLTLTSPVRADSDLSGMWVSGVSVGDRDSLWPTDPPYTEAGLAAQAIATTAADPAFNCVIGFGRIMSAGFPTEIIQTEKQVTILYEYDHQVRRVFIDGRGHPKKIRQNLMGHSTGYWEGSTLVVETVGFVPSFFRLGGIPYSEEAQIIERMTLLDDGQTLESLITVTDPKYYSESWQAKKYMTLDPGATILEYDCTVREHLQPE